MNKSFLINLCSLFLLILFTFSSLPAIETGEIKGKVQSDTGEPLAGVLITVRGPNLQGFRETVSRENGSFSFPLLPVGTYKLSFRLKGFSPVIQEEVVVLLGQVTNLTVIMKVAEISEEIIIQAPSPLIDKTSTDTSFHLSSTELNKLPVSNRSIVDIIKLAPGVTGVRVNTRRGLSEEGQPSFRGEGEEGNNWVVDGLSIAGVRLRNSGVNLNLDSVDEIQVISDPFSPEYGSAYGGIINVVTKSGGNEFSGEFSLVFTDKNLQASRQEQLAVVSEADHFSNYNWYLNLGGPIIKDKLWFFISDNIYSDTSETRDQTVDYLFVPGGEKTIRINNFFAKLTYAVNSNHNISLTSLFQNSFDQKGGVGIPELYEKKDFSDVLFRFNYKGILSSAAYMEAGLGFIRRGSSTQPLHGDLGPAQYYIEDLGRSLHNSYGNVADDQARLDANVKLSSFLETQTFGRHEFDIGLEYFSFSSDFGVDFTGKDEDLFPGNGFDAGTKYYFNTWENGRATPTFFYEYGDFWFTNSSRGLGIYVQDKINWGRVSTMIGIRSQTQACLDHNQEELWSWGFGDFLSPRLSLAWDIGGDGNNILKLGWGRFSDVITTMPMGLFNSGAGLSFRTYRWNGPITPSTEEIHDPENWIFENEQKKQKLEIAEGITPNFITRYLVEYDRRLGAHWALTARYVVSKARDLLEVLAVFDPQTGFKFLYDNFELKRRDYQGLELELNGKIGRSLFLKASYCLSSAKGTNPGQTETGSWSQEEGSTNYIGLFGNHLYIPDMPEFKEYKEYIDWALGGLGGRGIGDEGWYGKLPYSVDHNLKINVIFLGPYGLSFSAAFEHISGYYWEKLGYVPFFGGYYSFPEGRGSRKTPAHTYFDIGVEKELFFKGTFFGDSFSFLIRFDLFNLLNSQKPISYVKENIPIFGEVWARQQPRQARLSLKIKW
ncbi:MAG: TonB-dependent receptor [Acidobacteriota bacterium]